MFNFVFYVSYGEAIEDFGNMIQLFDCNDHGNFPVLNKLNFTSIETSDVTNHLFFATVFIPNKI